MASKGWREILLGDFITLQRGFDLPAQDRKPGKVPIVSSSGISDYHAEAAVSGPGVVTGRYGTIGKVFYLEEDFWPLNTTLWVKDFHGNDRLFASYLLRTIDFTSCSDKSSVPGVNRNDLHQIPIRTPGVDEQKAVAGLLRSLDNKIQHNHCSSRALQELAQAIFRAWFVEFEPVKAKAAGATAFPSMPQSIFHSLPNRLVNSELGPIPQGWEVTIIDEVVAVKGGGTPSTKNPEYWDEGVHFWATPKDMSSLSDPVILETERRITDAGVQQISSGMLPTGTVLLSSRAPVGYLAIAGIPIAINQGFIAMVCEGALPPIYIYNWTQSVMDEIKGRASGTTFPEISKTAFRPIKICVPKTEVAKAFAQIANPLFDLITVNARESRKLAELRDYLLPRLLDGRVLVGAAHA